MAFFGYEYQARQRREALALGLIRFSAVFVLAVLGGLLGFIVYHGAAALNWEFLSAFPRNGLTEGGLFPAILGTLCLALGSLSIALPLGCGAAIYLAEYARPGRLLTVIRLGISNLSGVPSVVFGLFGLALFVGFLGLGRSILSGSLTLAMLVLPTVTSAAEEALRQTPQSFREAAIGLGASRWQAVRQVVLPAALPNMLTGAILALGRAAGETAPIMFTAAAAYTLALPDSPFSEVMALSTHIYNLATSGTHIEETRHLQYGAALVLMALVLGMSLLAIILRSRLRRNRRW
ncbi:MAG: phosphate ABC transporter permease PstA [Candidatus Adiutrix sp.]|jgi:phosphate transport system permease protein|nr:phosphate ABC transporter permease PstA [Candidatus Adiutrix sp.]